jgi:hypothetical protein
VGEIALELRRMNIHSIDGCVVYLPKDKLLLAADTLEDPLTYIIEPENLAEHLDGMMEHYIGDSAAKGWVHFFEPYREVHEQNLKVVHDYWKDKTLPEIAP